MEAPSKERWGSRLGVILAVAGSAVGLGNFLRFPGQAAQYGGGAFMIAYFVSFLLLGLPICWAEWTMGRYAGSKGFNSCPGIFNVVAGKAGRYLGVIGVIIPVIIYMYYVYIEAWCLGYAVNFLRGLMHFETAEEAGAFWQKFIGIGADGSAIGFGWARVGPYLLIVFVLNFVLIYRGLSKGIEWFCKYAMPMLVLIALVILLRVLTLGAPDPQKPSFDVMHGLGFMWNPTKIVVEKKNGEGEWMIERELLSSERIEAAKIEAESDVDTRVRAIGVIEQLGNPELWLAAAGQIFFSLSVGFGIVLTYSSYLSRKDDVVLSGLSATSANEFCEVALGGLITIPAGVAFLGVAGVATQASTFGLGFNVLPMVFSSMPAGAVFGFLFFFLLFLAAVTSSLSMLQPGIAFLEESLEIGRRRSVAILGFITAVGCGFVVYFSADVKALDTMDFWVGTFLIFILATIQIILFGWVLGIEKGVAEAHVGSSLHIPSIFKFIMKYISPIFLLVVFALWVLVNVFGFSFATRESKVSYYVTDLFGQPNIVAWMSLGLIALVAAMVALIVSTAKVYDKPLKGDEP